MTTLLRSAPRKTKPPRPAPTPAGSPWPTMRFSVEQYHQMIEAGILTSENKVELINGWIIDKMPINPPHAYSVGVLSDILPAICGAGWAHFSQQPLTMIDSEPEPDHFVAAGPRSKYKSRHPGPDDIALVIEVANTTLTYDRTTKLVLYASAGIPVYWIVNLKERQVEVYTQPRNGKNSSYRNRTVYKADAEVPVTLRRKTLGIVAVAELLP